MEPAVKKVKASTGASGACTGSCTSERTHSKHAKSTYHLEHVPPPYNKRTACHIVYVCIYLYLHAGARNVHMSNGIRTLIFCQVLRSQRKNCCASTWTFKQSFGTSPGAKQSSSSHALRREALQLAVCCTPFTFSTQDMAMHARHHTHIDTQLHTRNTLKKTSCSCSRIWGTARCRAPLPWGTARCPLRWTNVHG